MLNRKERERERHRREIILAAVHLFARKGFNNTKLEDVATLAEFGKGTIYNHFENKNDLLLSSLKYVIDDAYEYLLGKLQDVEDVIDRIKLMVTAEHQYYQENEDFMHLMLSQHKTVISEIMGAGNSDLYKKFKQHDNLLTVEFQRAIDDSRLKPGSAKSYTILLTGMIHGQFKALIMGEISQNELNPLEPLEIFFNGAMNE